MRCFPHFKLAVCLMAAVLAAPGQEPGITREQADAILTELRQIRQLLERTIRSAQGAPEQEQKAKLKIDGAWLGSKEAPVTMVEFTDYQCGFCRRFHVATFPELRKKYIDTGKVRFLSRDLPLEMHSNAFRAAEAARCAGDQGRYWEMRDVLISNSNRLGPEDLAGYAQQLKLNIPEFRACLDKGKYKDAIERDKTEAASLKIGGTPSFIIGRSTPDGVEGEVVVGAQPLPVFEAKLSEFGIQ